MENSLKMLFPDNILITTLNYEEELETNKIEIFHGFLKYSFLNYNDYGNFFNTFIIIGRNLNLLNEICCCTRNAVMMKTTSASKFSK